MSRCLSLPVAAGNESSPLLLDVRVHAHGDGLSVNGCGRLHVASGCRHDQRFAGGRGGGLLHLDPDYELFAFDCDCHWVVWIKCDY